MKKEFLENMAIILGDVHGDVEKVRAFLSYKPMETHVALGDYADSFFMPPDQQLEALKLLLESQSVLLWGNHDLHYLSHPPFFSPGYQPDQQLHQIIEANKHRFLAAFVADNFLCTHAGVHSGLVKKSDSIIDLAERFNSKMEDFLKTGKGLGDSIFRIGKSRGGDVPARRDFLVRLLERARFINGNQADFRTCGSKKSRCYR